MFTLKFKTENDAFGSGGELDDDLLLGETARILREVADQVENARAGGPVYDANGNRIGEWSLSVDERAAS